MDRQTNISTGMSDESIAESGPSVPDDSGRMVEVRDEKIRCTKASLLRDRLDDLKDELDEQIDLPQRGAP